jgi:hypothetical protein
MKTTTLPHPINNPFRTPLCHGRRWGNWRLDGDVLSLQFLNKYGNVIYDIDLERIVSAAAMLDCIVQFREKGWATVDDRDNLAQAFQDIFDPQRNLCPSGMNERISDPANFLKEQLRTRGMTVEGQSSVVLSSIPMKGNQLSCGCEHQASCRSDCVQSLPRSINSISAKHFGFDVTGRKTILRTRA